nr:hypothetical protein [Tanacetum cinerariifolium]
ITKKVLGGAILKLVTRVKRLEGLLQQRKQRLVLSDSEGEDTTLMKQDIDLEALYTLARTSLGGTSSDTPTGHDAAEVPANTSMPSRNPSTTRRRLKKPFSSFASAHVSENIPAGASVPTAATTIPAEDVGPTTSTRLPSPTRHTSAHEAINKGGGDFVSSPQSNEAPQTPVTMAASEAEDSDALTTLSLKLDRCLNKVKTLENEHGITKKVLGGAILKLVTRVKRLEGLLQQRKQRL